MALYDEMERVVLGRGGRRTPSGVIRFPCPFDDHSSHGPSAWLSNSMWGCWACGVTSTLVDLAGRLGIPTGDGPENRTNYTLEDYAAAKYFETSLLREWGLKTEYIWNNQAVVAIPHRDQDGNLLRTKYRGLREEKVAQWWAGDGTGNQLYGLDRLGTEGPIAVVEGASDVHACWHHDVAALGLPGATTWRSEWADYLRGRPIYLWQEPDDAGSEFVKRIRRDLPFAKVIDPGDVKDLADLHIQEGGRFNEVLDRLMAEATVPDPRVTFTPLLRERIADLLTEKLRPVDAVPTPWRSWNQACRDAGGRVGLARTWNTLLAAGPGTGKSVGASNMAAAAIRNGEQVTFISLEMSRSQLDTRMMAIISGLGITSLEEGDGFSEIVFEEAARKIDEIYEDVGGFVRINDRTIRSLLDVIDAVRYYYEVEGCRYFITDYLQLAWTGRADGIYQQIVEVSHTLSNLAKEIGVVHVGLSQFNRDAFKDREPTIHDLMGGSPLENDSDQVVLLIPDKSKNEREGGKLTKPSDMYLWARLRKNRHGPMVDVPVRFSKASLRMEEVLEDEMPSYKIDAPRESDTERQEDSDSEDRVRWGSSSVL